jgi:hypothetical protein
VFAERARHPYIVDRRQQHRPGSAAKAASLIRIMARFTKTDASEFIIQQQSKKTKDATKFAVKILRQFCSERDMETDFEVYRVPALVTLLRDFYPNIRNQSGEIYSKSSLCAIRQGIRRYLLEPPHERPFDILHDPRFQSANNAFNSMLKKTRQEGKGHVQHKRPIPEGKYTC